MLEVKELLIDLESVGAKITVKDGAPRLHGKVPSELMDRIKSLRSEIIAFLSAPPEAAPTTLFPEAPVKQDALDVTGKREAIKTKKKVEIDKPKTFKMVAGQCSCCAQPINGYLATTSFQHEMYVYEDGEFFYCSECNALLDAIEAGEQAKQALKDRSKPACCNAVKYEAVKCDMCSDGIMRYQKGDEVIARECMKCDGKGRVAC